MTFVPAVPLTLSEAVGVRPETADSTAAITPANFRQRVYDLYAAMRDALREDGARIEGAAGVAIAGYRKLTTERPELASLESVVVLCGGNVSDETMARIERGVA